MSTRSHTIVTCDLCKGSIGDRATYDAESDDAGVGWMTVELYKRTEGGLSDSVSLDVCPDHAKAFEPFILRYAR